MVNRFLRAFPKPSLSTDMTIRNTFALLIVASLASCSGRSDESVSEDSLVVDTVAQSALLPGVRLHDCYVYQTEKDSAFLRIDILDDEMAAGALSYTLLEKDHNVGSFTGTVHGDTIFAHYTFSSEGTESVREVALLKKAEGWIEGFGEVKDSAGMMIFADRSKVDFAKGLYFKPAECPPEPPL